MLECMIGGCQIDPTEEIIVDDNGLLLVYVVCSFHKQGILQFAMLTAPTDPTQGLVGPA